MARQQGTLVHPKQTPDVNDIDRDEWINQVFEGFVASRANKAIYKVVLETLWPLGHGIPGPLVSEVQLREAINAHQARIGKGSYYDPFRRIRELQGEEGVLGIIKQGKTYQLIELIVQPKRIPREALSPEDWQFVLQNYSFRCAVCGRSAPEVKFDQDHKVPRLRGGGNELSNWQPLCVECNNFKSTACRGCDLDCYKCPWAFPERFAPIKVSGDNTARLRELANRLGIDVNDLANEALERFFSSKLP